MVPEHIFWSINNTPYANFKQYLDSNIKLKTFDYQIKHLHTDCESFRQECINAAKLLPDNIAIPLSGSDSEIVARSVKALDKNAIIYYEHYPWALKEHRNKSKQIADELNYEWIEYCADKSECIDRMKRFSVALGNMSRGFLITIGLFEKIPVDQFIVGGLGELEKDGWIYRKTMENCIGEEWDKQLIIPCPPTEIIWWIWAMQNNRPGQYTFFNSTLPLIKSQAQHPLLSFGKHNKGVCNTMAMKNYEWPELIYKEKTDHFHPNDNFYNEIYEEMRLHLESVYDPKLFTLVKNGFCGFVNYSQLLNNTNENTNTNSL
tara:strand:- start:3224 stop:4177 length:954 start_codon:yes stop_codon:yes gene_type:complete